MKKSILTIVMVFAASMLVNAQIMKIQLKDGNVIPVPLKDIASITYDMEGSLDGKKAELVSDPMIGDMMQLAAMAQQYYKKPTTLGGGGNRFTGWWIPDNMKESPNGTFTAKIETEKVTLVGVSKTSKREGKPMKFMMLITKDKISETTVE